MYSGIKCEWVVPLLDFGGCCISDEPTFAFFGQHSMLLSASDADILVAIAVGGLASGGSVWVSPAETGR